MLALEEIRRANRTPLFALAGSMVSPSGTFPSGQHWHTHTRTTLSCGKSHPVAPPPSTPRGPIGEPDYYFQAYFPIQHRFRVRIRVCWGLPENPVERRGHSASAHSDTTLRSPSVLIPLSQAHPEEQKNALSSLPLLTTLSLTLFHFQRTTATHCCRDHRDANAVFPPP